MKPLHIDPGTVYPRRLLSDGRPRRERWPALVLRVETDAEAIAGWPVRPACRGGPAILLRPGFSWRHPLAWVLGLFGRRYAVPLWLFEAFFWGWPVEVRRRRSATKAAP